jgi:hypothetical protein
LGGGGCGVGGGLVGWASVVALGLLGGGLVMVVLGWVGMEGAVLAVWPLVFWSVMLMTPVPTLPAFMLVPPTKVLVLVVLGLVVLVLAEAVAALLTLEVLGLVLVPVFMPVYKLVVPVVAPVLVLLLTGKSKVLGLLTSWGGVEGQEDSKEASAG